MVVQQGPGPCHSINNIISHRRSSPSLVPANIHVRPRHLTAYKTTRRQLISTYLYTNSTVDLTTPLTPLSPCVSLCCDCSAHAAAPASAPVPRALGRAPKRVQTAHTLCAWPHPPPPAPPPSQEPPRPSGSPPPAATPPAAASCLARRGLLRSRGGDVARASRTCHVA